jgi:SAM-dependent methyltransferase
MPIIRDFKATVFRFSRGHHSNHRWYGHYKRRELERALRSPVNLDRLPPGYGRWLDERMVEYPWMLSRLSEDPENVLDAGSTLNHRLILRQPRLRNKKITILTLAPEAECFWREGVSYVFCDLRDLYFRDACFDSVVCLSVLEHIGLDNRVYHPNTSAAECSPNSYVAAVAELRRVLKHGGKCLITVPFGKHEVRNWIQVFDSAVLERLLSAFKPSKHDINYFLYSKDQQWQHCCQDAAADALYFDLHADVPWPGCPAGAGAVACLDLVK